MELTLHNATNMFSTIKELSNNKSLDHFALVCLKDCLHLYSDAITTLANAVEAFLSEDYGTANTVMEATTTCEGGFKENEATHSSSMQWLTTPSPGSSTTLIALPVLRSQSHRRLR
ncbi:hypothetical protein EV1_013158 [Malus domestica]